MRMLQRVAGVATTCLCIAGAAMAQPASGNRPTDTFWLMSPATWQILQSAPGIVSAGQSSDAAIQVVFDANCPYSAKIYQYFKRAHPHVAVRWTPVAFMRPDSYARAAAILASARPDASLDKDLGNYNFATRHGGYKMPSKGAAPTLGSGQRRLQKIWETKWGSYTPMIFFRDSRGRVFQAQTDQPEVIDQVVERAAHPLKPYP